MNEPMGSCFYVLLCGCCYRRASEWEPNLWRNWLDTTSRVLGLVYGRLLAQALMAAAASD